MLEYLLLILLCQLVGEAIVTFAGIPFPGPVIGMLLLFGFLLVRGGIPTPLGTVANSLLNHLSLLFVPAGVGVILHLQLLAGDALPITASLVVSTLVTIAVTGLLMNGFRRRQSPEGEQQGEQQR